MRPPAPARRTSNLALALALTNAAATALANEPTSTPLPAANPGRGGFMRLETTGITFANRLVEADAANDPSLWNGSGLAAADVDGDGWVDLYFCRIDGENALYRNLGRWKFADITESAGVGLPADASRCAAFADLDGDGDPDLLVGTQTRGARVFRNDGRGRFTNVSAAAGTGRPLAATALALADLEGDGDLDLYAGYTGGPETGQVFLNRGDGTFTDAGDPAPPDSPVSSAATRAARFLDLNGDLAPDLVVAGEQGQPTRLWLNDGRGRLGPGPALRGAGGAVRGLDAADVDGDGDLDLFLAGARRPGQPPRFDAHGHLLRNRLYLNRGDGAFTEMAALAGLSATDLCAQPLFLDGDLDGRPDLWIAGGHPHDELDASASAEIEARRESGRLLAGGARSADLPPGPQRARVETRERLAAAALLPRLELPLQVFLNRGPGVWTNHTARLGTDALAVRGGLVAADLDGDGDLDLAANQLDAPAGIFRNDSTAPRVLVHLRGVPPNPDGIGARVTLRAPGLPEQTQVRTTASPSLTFATGAAPSGITLDVHWRSGRVSRRIEVRPGTGVEIGEASAVAEDRKSAPPDLPWFEEMLARPGASENGTPAGALAWADVDRDGWEDLVHARGGAGPFAVFRNDGKGGFLAAVTGNTQATALAWNGRRLWLGGTTAPLLALDGTRAEPEPLPATGPTRALALADVDGDHDVDLFLAGPQGGLFLRGVTTWSRAPGPALDWAAVRALLSADFTGDGRPDLLVLLPHQPPGLWVCGEGGTFAEAGANTGLLEAAGDWRCLATGDFDGDGRLDLALGNTGVNREPDGTPPEHLRHAVFLNRAPRWERRDLPEIAQLAPAAALAVADFDADGREDVWIAQNGYDGPVRLDAGEGLWLRGDGTGEFAATPATGTAPLQSGLGLAVAAGDFDHDGRLDVALAAEGGELRVFRNRLAPPGLRVTLGGTAGNPASIGARVRLVTGGVPGPMRAILAGSDGRSQSAPTLVFPAPPAAAELEIHWPGGPITRQPVPPGPGTVFAPRVQTTP